jgi:hypothetical protein
MYYSLLRQSASSPLNKKVMFQRSPWSLSTELTMTLKMETQEIPESFVFSSTLAQLIAQED